MKKQLCVALSALAILGGSLTSCAGEVVYTVEKKDFYYSFDNGATYGNERVELEVGKQILMKVIIDVKTNRPEDKEKITGSLSIPMIKSIDAYYIRGQKITPEYDEINKLTTYPFTVLTNDKEPWIFIFEFQPLDVARVQMSLDFDEPIDDMYDGIYTIKFVEPKKDNTEEAK